MPTPVAVSTRLPFACVHTSLTLTLTLTITVTLTLTLTITITLTLTEPAAFSTRLPFDWVQTPEVPSKFDVDDTANEGLSAVCVPIICFTVTTEPVARL